MTGPQQLEEWYELVNDPQQIVQGELLDGFPIVSFEPAELPLLMNPDDTTEPLKNAQVATYNVVVMTQSCDFQKLEDKDLVTLCARWDLRDVNGFNTKDKWSPLVKRQITYAYLLSCCHIPGHELDYQLVNFRTILTVSFGMLREFVRLRSTRLRLRSPYREDLAQAFARLFMRVGLPNDLPTAWPYS